MRRAAWLLAALLALPAQAAPRTVVTQGSEVAFSLSQMGGPIAGRFGRFGGSVDLDPAQPGTARIHVEVEIASITTGDRDTDDGAREKSWLDAAGFPRASFDARAVRATPAGFEAEGTLSIRGRSQPVRVPFTFVTAAAGTALASGGFSFRRSAFAIGDAEWGDTVGDEVAVRFRLQLAPPSP